MIISQNFSCAQYYVFRLEGDNETGVVNMTLPPPVNGNMTTTMTTTTTPPKNPMTTTKWKILMSTTDGADCIGAGLLELMAAAATAVVLTATGRP